MFPHVMIPRPGGGLASNVTNDSGVTGSSVADALDWLSANKQPLDATLTALAGLTIAANTITIGSGSDAFSQTTFAANTFPARGSSGNLVAKTITDFGLSLVDDADASAGRTTLGLGTVATLASDTDGTLAANSDSVIATQKAVRTFVENAVTGLLDFKGSTDCSSNPNYPAASKGDSYVVSVAGKIGGASGTSVDGGDVYLATADNAGGTQASVGTSWTVLEHNLNGALLAANNLSELASASTARTNLGLGSLATVSNLTGPIASSGGTTSITSQTGTGTTFVMSAGPTFTGTISAANITLTGDLSVQGNTTIGNASGDTLTLNAAAVSIPNAVTITKTAQSATAETLMSWLVSDNATDKFELVNGSATDGAFAPSFKGSRSGAGVCVTFAADGGTDTGVNPLLLFQSQIGGVGVGTRPLASFWNNQTPGFEISAGYNVQLRGGATSPTLIGATADIVSFAGIDRLNTRHAAAGNRSMAVQAERGSAIYIGDDAIDFAATTAYLTVNSTDIAITSTAITLPQKFTTYGGLATSGQGVSVVSAQNSLTGQTGATTVASVTRSAEASFTVHVNVLVTTSTTHNFTVTVTYTDVGNTSRTVTLNFQTTAGTIATAIANAGGAIPYHGLAINLRAKASTAVTVATTGTFTSVVYNVDASITQTA